VEEKLGKVEGPYPNTNPRPVEEITTNIGVLEAIPSRSLDVDTFAMNRFQ
jgi:hypothetical protein